MNAATVKGPRSRITSGMFNGCWVPDRRQGRACPGPGPLFLPDGDEDLAALTAAHAPDEDARDAARLHLLQLAACLGGGRHALAVHGEDHVALPKRSGRRAV